MAKKVTKKEMFIAIMTKVADNQEMVDFINREIELLDKRAATPKKPTKTQKENAVFKEDIFRGLTTLDKPVTISEIKAAVPSVAGLTTQRIAHMLSDLIEDGRVERAYVKKIAYFSAVKRA